MPRRNQRRRRQQAVPREQPENAEHQERMDARFRNLMDFTFGPPYDTPGHPTEVSVEILVYEDCLKCTFNTTRSWRIIYKNVGEDCEMKSGPEMIPLVELNKNAVDTYITDLKKIYGNGKQVFERFRLFRAPGNTALVLEHLHLFYEKFLEMIDSSGTKMKVKNLKIDVCSDEEMVQVLSRFDENTMEELDVDDFVATRVGFLKLENVFQLEQWKTPHSLRMCIGAFEKFDFKYLKSFAWVYIVIEEFTSNDVSNLIEAAIGSYNIKEWNINVTNAITPLLLALGPPANEAETDSKRFFFHNVGNFKGATIVIQLEVTALIVNVLRLDIPDT